MRDFDYEKSGLCDERKLWLQLNRDKKLGEAAFVAAWMELRKFSKAKHKGSRNNPSNARAQYKGLTEEFGFFQGE